ncbi:MAG: dTDP-4-dehydrorhamnose 3,5-epimerase family protein [Elusimicrobia bacterium]|nr:dTDP-4-dehydrorhamnose 3,5-epimerase family protein [Candidatus Liberimonas magnetica]
MKIISVEELKLPEVKVITFGRYLDERGYFSEVFRKSDFNKRQELSFLKEMEFFQCNESFSRPGTVRGLHFQWDPCMGKLIRTITGRMVDIILDIRKGSPTFGKIIMYDMPAKDALDFNRFIWVPEGFAHGNFFTENTIIEYFCTSEYSPGNEAGISPLSKHLDWSLCDPGLKKEFESLINGKLLVTDKDKNSYSLRTWQKDPKSDNFIYIKCKR